MEKVPLLDATISGDIDTVVHLLDTGVTTVDVHNARRETPLYWAAARGDLDLCQMLIKHGAAIDFQSVAGLTPLHAAADRGHHQCVQLLLHSGANPDERSAARRTPLHLAAYRGNMAVMRALLRHGARHDITDTDGKTPVDVSACQGHWEDVRLLLNHRGHSRVAQLKHANAHTVTPPGGQNRNLSRQRSRSADRSSSHNLPYLEDIGRVCSDDQIQLRSSRTPHAESNVNTNGMTCKVQKPFLKEHMTENSERKPNSGVTSWEPDRKRAIMTPGMILSSMGVNLPAISSLTLDEDTEKIKHLLGEFTAGLDIHQEEPVRHVITCLLQGLHQVGKHSEKLQKEVREWKERTASLGKENEALRKNMAEILLSTDSSTI